MKESSIEPVASLFAWAFARVGDLPDQGSKWSIGGAPAVSKQFHSLLESANLPKIRIHDLRHTAATLLLLQDVNPRTVMELLGHSDVTMTLNTYSHVLASLKEDAARRMDTALATNS